ncbi:RNA-directed DNA polymerase from mobile element jockey [Pitangus sulphuratus]|nr:RNA-directed DNA polymerase from mobile element jockey [Pitangus sulphuratus]
MRELPLLRDRVALGRPRGFQCPELENQDGENHQIPVVPEIVWKLLIQLNPYRPMKSDGIHPRILKDLAAVIAKPLSTIFEWSGESGDVPADWKLVKVVPVFKKGKKEDPRNYRILMDKMASTQAG